jgi:hypothetical protein
MSRVVRTSALLALLPLALTTAGGAVASSPGAQAHAAKGCSLSSKEQKNGLGASYVTSLNVSGTSCATGKAVVRAYHACRRAHGWKGKCGHKVKHYRCSRRILDSTSFQYDAKVTCKRGSKRVVHTYTENK